MSIEELRAELALTRRMAKEVTKNGDHFGPKLDTVQLLPPKHKTCPLLKKLPIEVRNQIYKLLLINEVLSINRSINRSVNRFHPRRRAINYTPEEKFDLEPQLLRTCHQIYVEASRILYGSNTFIIDCTDDLAIFSPILRHATPDGSHSSRVNSFQFEDHLATRQVKHWKIVIGASKSLRWTSRQAPLDSVVQFCRAISQHPPKSLTVSMVPRGYCFEDNIRRTFFHPQYHDMVQVLKPLRMLRKIGKISIVSAGDDEWALYAEPTAGDIQPHDVSPDLVNELTLLAQGDTPVRHLFLMNRKLISYAQTFERNELFKLMMRSSQGKALHRLNPKSDHVFYSFYQEDHSYENPYRQVPYHPVENALDHASIATELDAVPYFLQARKTVLEYLEPQYRRISECALQMVEYVKQNKIAGGGSQVSLSAQSCMAAYSPQVYCAGIMLLEDYAKSFVRDAPWTTHVNMRKMQRSYELSYSTLPRELLLQQLSNAFEGRNYYTTVGKFVELFKLAVDDMDKQLLEIRKARKKLFDMDFEDFGHDIDLELWRCDEMIDWTVNELQLEPRFLPSPQERQRIDAERAANRRNEGNMTDQPSSGDDEAENGADVAAVHVDSLTPSLEISLSEALEAEARRETFGAQ